MRRAQCGLTVVCGLASMLLTTAQVHAEENMAMAVTTLGDSGVSAAWIIDRTRTLIRVCMQSGIKKECKDVTNPGGFEQDETYIVGAASAKIQGTPATHAYILGVRTHNLFVCQARVGSNGIGDRGCQKIF